MMIFLGGDMLGDLIRNGDWGYEMHCLWKGRYARCRRDLDTVCSSILEVE